MNAFVGLTVNTPPDLIRYDLPLKQWVVHVTQSLIRHHRSLNVIRYVNTDREERSDPLTHHCAEREISNGWLRMEGLPSWCPDWTQATNLRTFGAKSQRRHILSGHFSAARGTIGDVEIKNSTVLEASGTLSDSVSILGQVSNQIDGADNDTFLQWCLLVTKSHVLHSAICDGCNMRIYGVRHKCKVCPSFDLCSICLVEEKDKHPDHAFEDLETNSFAISAGIEKTSDNDSALYRDPIEPLVLTSKEQDDRHRARDAVWIDLDKARYPFTQSSTLYDAFRNSLTASRSAFEVVARRKVPSIVEEIAFAEWWQSRVEKLPYVAFPAKSGYSVEEVGKILNSITRQHVSMVESMVHGIARDVRLIVGEKGYIGWGPKETQVGDMIAVLKGADTPFVLRRNVSTSNTRDEIDCTLVGEAYIHGLMHGEAIEAVRVGLSKATKFCIY